MDEILATHDLPEADAERVLSRILAEFFTNDTIQFDRTQYENQTLDARGRVTLGWRLPLNGRDVGSLIHEMAHFVEIDEDRMGKDTWGLRMPPAKYIPGRYGGTTYCEPKTMQITAREIRVMAMQHHVHLHFGIPVWREKVPQLVSYFADSYMVPGGYGDDGRRRWILSVYDRLTRSKRYSFESFKAEWDRRCAILATRKAYRLPFVKAAKKAA